MFKSDKLIKRFNKLLPVIYMNGNINFTFCYDI